MLDPAADAIGTWIAWFTNTAILAKPSNTMVRAAGIILKIDDIPGYLLIGYFLGIGLIRAG